MSALSKLLNSAPVKKNAIILASSMIFVYYTTGAIIKRKNSKYYTFWIFNYFSILKSILYIFFLDFQEN